jgi:hypothetical protein
LAEVHTQTLRRTSRRRVLAERTALLLERRRRHAA